MKHRHDKPRQEINHQMTRQHHMDVAERENIEDRLCVTYCAYRQQLGILLLHSTCQPVNTRSHLDITTQTIHADVLT